jgi:CheY-like chemotaxis protein
MSAAPVDVREVLTRAIETSRPLIDSRGHTLEVTVPDQPMFVVGDAVRLTQGVLNLLNNAAKYTPEGGRIRLSAVTRGAEVEIRVADNGMGIERDMLEKVFDLFVQADPMSNSTLGGLGVGLALVRRVVELHGGSVQARSGGKGFGAEFIVRLPLSAQTFQPDLVLLDIGMPQKSGYDVAREIFSAASARKPVLVAVTGWGQDADKDRAAEAGFQYHFIKPISEGALRTILSEVAKSKYA